MSKGWLSCAVNRRTGPALRFLAAMSVLWLSGVQPFLAEGAYAFSTTGYESCYRLQTTCVDSGCKIIDGLEVCRDCWQYDSTYACYTPDVDYCAPIRQEEGCVEVGQTCSATDHRGQCIQYTREFQCGDELDPKPTNTVKLDDVYVIADEHLDFSQCDGSNEDPYCGVAEKVCIEGPETRNIDGKEVYRECWKWDYTYNCLGEWDDTCSDLESDPACTYQSQECFSATEIDGIEECTASTRTYECSEEGLSRTFESCGSTELCADGNCFDTDSPSAANDFLRAATAMEAAREAGEYFNEDAFELFKGEANNCRSWLRFGSLLSVFGDPNCCKAGEGTAKSNQSVMGEAAKGAGKAILDEGYSVASNYMYDFMFKNGNSWMADKAVDAWMTGAWGGKNAFTPSFGMYGFTVNFGGGAAAGTTLFSSSGFTVAFDPVSFGIAVGLAVLQQWASCPEDELMTGGKVDADLCHYVGEHCTKDVFLIGCVRKHAEYCCFNSKLARIIQEQGRPQLGISWGSPGSQNCRGFKPEEFEQLDFSKIDMSEFYEDVLKEVEVPDSSTIEAVVEKNKQIVQEKMGGMQ